MLTVQQVAERLQVAPQTVYLLIQRGKLATHRFGNGRGTIRVSEEDLRAFIDSCRTEPVEPNRIPPRRMIRNPTLKHLRL